MATKSENNSVLDGERPQKSASASKKTRRSRSKKSSAKSNSGTSRHIDIEAVGLVLLGLAILVSCAVFLPIKMNPMAELNKSLFAALGLGMYLTPLPLVMYGFVSMAKAQFKSSTRVLLGVLVLATAALFVIALYRPELAGSLSSVARPLRPVPWLGILLAVVVASFGVEIILNLRLSTFLRGFAVISAIGALKGATAAKTGYTIAKSSASRAAQSMALRGQLEAHQKDLDELQNIYPGASELKLWRKDCEAALDNVSGADEELLGLLRDDVGAWRKTVSGFSESRAKDLAGSVETEDLGAEPIVRDAQKTIAGIILSSTQVARALENVRRTLQLDAKTLEDALRRDKRERESALKALNNSIRPGDLASELERHTTRIENNKQLLARAEGLRSRTGQFAGWPELVARLEKPHHADVVAFADNLSATLKNASTDALPELPQWQSDLDELERQLAMKTIDLQGKLDLEGLVWEDPNRLAGVPRANVNDVVEAVFEIDLPGGNAVSGEDVDKLMRGEFNGLEVTEVQLEAGKTPWVSPTERAAQKVASAQKLADIASRREKSKPDAPGIADSNVGERIVSSDVPLQGGIPIQVPGVAFLDPFQASGFDAAAFDRDETFVNFGLNAKVVDFARGPTVTRYEIEPAPGEKISRIASVQNDLARVLSVGGVRIEAPVPGKSVIGIEVPNSEREPITFRAGIESENFQKRKTKLPLLLGKSIDGDMLIEDLAKMPHLLIAGSTGSGKSVCVNTLIMSLLFRYLPTELRFVMVDPKMVELTPYDGIPHLVRPVVTNPNDAAGVLLGCVAHMERRYKMMSEIQAKNLEQYNIKAKEAGEPELPHLVIIIDELADLMITSPKEVESSIMRLAQMARATGMHLILATQRPSADVITGLIKVNIPARVAFAVSSGIDSRTILDCMGAERLTGYGDMLFNRPGLSKPMRLQGPYISENELARITEFLRRQFFDDDFGESYGSDFDGVTETAPTSKLEPIDYSDPFIKKAAEVVIEEGYAAVSRLQRRLSVGHARAGKLIDALEAMGIVGPYKGSKTRDVLVARDQLSEYFG
jgi:DNA segregation ATPase FtsK/SpoIIIE, S-DNA-T family